MIEKSKIIDYSHQILLLISDTVDWLLLMFIENYRLSILSIEHARGSNRIIPSSRAPNFCKTIFLQLFGILVF